MIACVSVPYFAAAVERREDPSLVARPLVIGGLPRTPGKVYAISREAARTGVRPGMPVRRAQGLCPQARFIPAAQARYQEVFEQIADLLTAFTNLVEPGDGHWQAADGRWRTTVSNDQLAATYSLDLGVLKETEAVEVVQQIGGAVRERARLAAAIGLARERFTAHVAATSVEPNEALLVAPGHGAAFLAPLPLDRFPLEKETARRLHLLGIHTLGQLAALPAGALLTQFGREGYLLHRLAQGRDERPIRARPPRALARAIRYLDGPVANRTILDAVTHAMAEELATQLQAEKRTGRELWLTLHLEDGATREGRLVLRRPTASADHIARTLCEFLAQARVPRGVVGVEVILAGLVPATGQQLELFAHGLGQECHLQAALKDLVARYGAGCFYRVSLADRTARLPERRFQLQEVEA